LLPLTEETNLVIPLSEWILHAACQQNRTWQQAGLPFVPIAVNFSPRQFQNLNFANMVTRILEETGLEPRWLEIEITEVALEPNANSTLQSLQELSQMGVRISLDDFGTGQSSLSCLQKFPIHTLKIDRSFIGMLKDNPLDNAMVSAIVATGRSFNLRVIAEGVESLQQLELLQQLQCEEAQGYWFSRPLNSEDATQFLHRGRVEP
jgi:EAL domain-containing protein (putative c-di-GMP-specific phosphodiesterase class I)